MMILYNICALIACISVLTLFVTGAAAIKEMWGERK